MINHTLAPTHITQGTARVMLMCVCDMHRHLSGTMHPHIVLHPNHSTKNAFYLNAFSVGKRKTMEPLILTLVYLLISFIVS